MVPAAGAANLDVMHCELVLAGGQTLELIRCSSGTGYLTQPVAEYPGYERQRLLATNRASDFAQAAVEPCRAHQVGARVTDLVDPGLSAGHRRQHRPPLKREIHHLPLSLHEQQRTCATCDDTRGGNHSTFHRRAVLSALYSHNMYRRDIVGQ